jgi:hypothetical protein
VYVIYRTYQGSGTEEDPPTDEEEEDTPGTATGGTITTPYTDTDGQAWTIHTFSASGTFTVTAAGKFDLFLLGGGGGTAGAMENFNRPEYYLYVGASSAGGGGGGGMLLVRNLELAPGTYAVSVGSGGTAGRYKIDLTTQVKSITNVGGTVVGTETIYGVSFNDVVSPAVGGSSSFGTLCTAMGGGYGDGLYPPQSAGSGGCGGGARHFNPGAAVLPTYPATGFDAPAYVSSVAGASSGVIGQYGGGGSSAVPPLSDRPGWLAHFTDTATWGVGGRSNAAAAASDKPGAGANSVRVAGGLGVTATGGAGRAGRVIIAYKI